MNDFIDISVGLHNDMPIWPGSCGFNRKLTSQMNLGDNANVSCIKSDLHAGTHVDAPLHFVKSGVSVDNLNLRAFIGPTVVADFRGLYKITADDLAKAKLPPDTLRLLFLTDNSVLWRSEPNQFQRNYVALTKDAAQWVVENKIQLIGIDYLSIQIFGDDDTTHRTLLKAGVIILEGIDLFQTKPGNYELMCLPLKIIGSEGAPARAVLKKTT